MKTEENEETYARPSNQYEYPHIGPTSHRGIPLHDGPPHQRLALHLQLTQDLKRGTSDLAEVRRLEMMAAKMSRDTMKIYENITEQPEFGV